jgi:hypothetical protein
MEKMAKSFQLTEKDGKNMLKAQKFMILSSEIINFLKNSTKFFFVYIF